MDRLQLTELIYRWRINNTIKRLEEKLDNEFYVTDLIYCPLKYKYQKLYKELTIASAVSPITMLGEFAHYGIEKILIDIFGVDNIKTEVKCEKGIEVDGMAYTIKGRIDAVIGDYIVEIKTGRSNTSIPQQHHIMQTRIYLWLIGYKKALLLYITANRITEYFIDKPATDGEIIDLIRSTISGAPAPRYQWECNYCTYSLLCPDKKHV